MTSAAQIADFNRVVQPVDMKSRDFKEYLVQLAWMNLPENHVYEEEIKIAEEELKITKKDWLKDLQLTFNLNEANISSTSGGGTRTNTVTTFETVDDLTTTKRETTTIEPVPEQTNVFFPRYNLGASFNIGTFATMKSRKKIKESAIEIAEHRLNNQKLAVRAEVLSRYQKLLLAVEILKTRTQIEQDAQSNFLLISQLYKTDEKSFEDYNEANTAYTTAMESRMKAETEVEIAKYDMEALIGISWKDVQHTGKTPL